MQQCLDFTVLCNPCCHSYPDGSKGKTCYFREWTILLSDYFRKKVNLDLCFDCNGNTLVFSNIKCLYYTKATLHIQLPECFSGSSVASWFFLLVLLLFKKIVCIQALFQCSSLNVFYMYYPNVRQSSYKNNMKCSAGMVVSH